MYWSLSWRNIWRNKKRTIIVAASVFFAVILALIMRSMQLGSYAYMIHSSAKLFTGYLQIQEKDYWEKRSLDNSITADETRIRELEKIQNVTSVTPRLETFALVSFGRNTKVSQITGIDPVREEHMTALREKLTRGQFLSDRPDGMLIGSGLAEILGAGIGDSVVIYGQGYHGQIAAAMVPITGIVKLPLKALDNAMVFLALPKAQEVFSCPGLITALPVMINNIRHLDQVEEDVRKELKDDETIMTWDQMMPDLLQNIEVDNASGLIMLSILYIVIGFGVFGTIMMMVSERAREFAILISVGMRKQKLMLVMALETVQVSFLGVLAGILITYPLLRYMVEHPIEMTGEMADFYQQLSIEPLLTFSAQPGIFISQALVVLAITVVTIVYPILFIRRLEPTRTIRG
jgi:ABC-type lipoprotein release transport system permease subunit